MKKQIILGSLVLSLLLAGCNRDSKEVVTKDPAKQVEINTKSEEDKEPKDKEEQVEPVVKVEEVEKEPEVLPVYVLEEGMIYNPLTGVPMSDTLKTTRPVAVTINNIKKALPQSGISQADVIYEVLAEGGITRLVAVFQNPNQLVKLGPVRSARRYFLDFALDQDAVYVHYGNDPSIWRDFKRLGVANMNGLSYLDNIMCWRDTSRYAPHNVYTNGEKIEKAWNSVGYRKDRKDEYPYLYEYSLFEQDIEDGTIATDIKIPYSPYITGQFVYNEELKEYQRFQFNQKQIDANTKEQLTTKNIIIQFANVRNRPGDREGRLDIQLIGTGSGYFISNGKVIPITWDKPDQKTPTMFKRLGGNQLLINPGKSWICVAPLDTKVTFE